MAVLVKIIPILMGGHFRADHPKHAQLLRDVVGNPFQQLPPLSPAILTWNEGLVVRLATAIYEEGDFTPGRMGILADALEDAGCDDQGLLNHCRGPGPHAKGCLAVDLVLGRE